MKSNCKNRKKSVRVCLVSLGCPKNLIDSEKMLAGLAQAGCIVGATMDQADAIVVNTCGFLAAARDESLSVIAEALKLKGAGLVGRVIVAGCLVNRDGQKLYDSAPGIDAIVGVNDRQAIAQAVLNTRRVTKLTPHAKIVKPAKPTIKSSAGLVQAGQFPSDSGRFRLTPSHTAYLRISEGCNQRCAFCTIPAIRGPFRSKPIGDVLAEAEELLSDGAIELNVIGQDTTSFGRDLPQMPSLAKLLRSLDRLAGSTDERWIRLMYAYPRRFTDELIDVLAEGSNIVKYIDLPLQHISDSVLKRMGRGVGRVSTEKLLSRMRERIPGVILRTTFIVGFPGETQRDFDELLAFVQRFKFDALGVFEFSPEAGTPAATMPAQVAPQVRADRARQIMLAQQKIAFAANKALKGKTIDVLVDGLDSAGQCIARYFGQGPDIDSVCILDKPQPAGRIVRAKVTGHRDYDLLVRAVGRQRKA
jgi:ribosomal protein S12 methylthiotransferase